MTRTARRVALLLDVGIDDVTMDGAVEAIAQMIEAAHVRGTTHQVATVNVDFLVNAAGDARSRRILQQADMCIADGMPLLWAARLTGQSLSERVAGVDLVRRLAAESAERGWRIHLFGSAAPIAERAADLLRSAYPGAAITADSGPSIADVDDVDGAVIAAISASRPDVLCVALGNPKQEYFIEANRARVGAPVMIGIGGTLDMIVGRRRRAPGWMQRIGLEWVFRAMQEPGRLGRRYARDAVMFLPRLGRDVIRAWSGRRGGHLRVCADGILRAAPGEPPTFPVATPAAGTPVIVDLAGTTRLSTAALAELVSVVRAARIRGDQVRVTNVGTSLAAQLELVGLAPPEPTTSD